MSQHIVHDQTSAQYAGGLDSVWAEWEPALRQAERLLHAGPAFMVEDEEATLELLRRVQYRAHTASEFASGLRPPLPAVDAHEYLVATLGAARDTLGVLSLRTELDELDEQMTDIGLHAISSTREAFQGARNLSVAAFRFSQAVEPVYVQAVPLESRGFGTLLWSLIVVCAVLFTVLLFEIFLLTPTG